MSALTQAEVSCRSTVGGTCSGGRSTRMSRAHRVKGVTVTATGGGSVASVVSLEDDVTGDASPSPLRTIGWCASSRIRKPTATTTAKVAAKASAMTARLGHRFGVAGTGSSAGGVGGGCSLFVRCSPATTQRR